MTICMICGMSDCIKHGDYEYPEELLRSLFGEKDSFAADLNGLTDVTVADVTRDIFGKKMIVPSSGRIRAEYREKRFDVRFADPRLLALGVSFYYANGRKIVQNAETATSAASIAPPPSVCDTISSETDLIARFGAEEGGIVYLIRPERYKAMSKADLVRELHDALKNLLPREKEKNINRIVSVFERGHISGETAVAALCSYFPHASEENFAIPMGGGRHIIHKGEIGLGIYLREASQNLYPEEPLLHQGILEMIRCRFFFSFLENVFMKSEAEIRRQYGDVLSRLGDEYFNLINKGDEA